jgi:hypothetical protein
MVFPKIFIWFENWENSINLSFERMLIAIHIHTDKSISRDQMWLIITNYRLNWKTWKKCPRFEAYQVFSIGCTSFWHDLNLCWYFALHVFFLMRYDLIANISFRIFFGSINEDWVQVLTKFTYHRHLFSFSFYHEAWHVCSYLIINFNPRSMISNYSSGFFCIVTRFPLRS